MSVLFYCVVLIKVAVHDFSAIVSIKAASDVTMFTKTLRKAHAGNIIQ